jgi:hypothetical protein
MRSTNVWDMTDVEEAAWMEEEAERKCVADLEKVRQAEIRIQQAEEKRRQEIVKEMVRFRSVCESFTNVWIDSEDVF